jgi:TRAP-type C4-dicarboxylate transport system permease small subunit
MAILRRSGAVLDRAVAGLLAALLTLMVLTVSWQVISRYLLAGPSGWTEELARFLLIWIGLFGGALAYRRRLHLGLELTADILHGTAHRWQQNAVDVCVLIFAVTILIVGGSSLVALTHELSQYSPALGLPMAVVYASLPLSGLLITVSALIALSGKAE